MAEIKFETVRYNETKILYVVHAQMRNPSHKMKVYLDKDTGDVLYPIIIERELPGVTITLDSDMDASCCLPPIISEEMVDGVIAQLAAIHDIVMAARKFIKEQQKLKGSR